MSRRIKCFFLEATDKYKKLSEKHSSAIFRRADTGEEMTLDEAPAGAMWYGDWYGKTIWTPQLEWVLIVKLPNGFHWVIDSQASNCTIPEDRQQKKHHCWIIEGTIPDITVSKNGTTCGAGAGSIQAGNYHGFLRNGYLEEC
jgi:hypothetical protein